MQTSDAGRKMIEAFEGCSLHAYRDSVGVPTIGYGHTTDAGGQPVTMGLEITQERADKMLRQDLGRVESSVDRLVTYKPLLQPQFDALVSFQYNTGWLAHPSCSLLRMLNAGKTRAAADCFFLYDRAGGHVLTGLQRRRDAERTLFLTGKYPDV
jgi:GH24 family phage-related lysozyme (muramidase)